jgi:DNA-binding CsgD family transcriptional regulator/PAS domain-containing protein
MKSSNLSEAELLSRLVAAIYDCALDPGRWPETLREVREALGFSNAMFTVWQAPAGRVLLNALSGIEPDYAAALGRHGADIVEQWGGAAAIDAFEVGEPKVLSWERPERGWIDSAYYRDWVAPQGIIDLMAVAVSRDQGTYCSVGFARHIEAGEIGPAEVAFTRLLVPHIQRAVAVSRILDVQAVTRATFAAVLDTLPAPVLVVDDVLGLVHANAAGDELLASSGGLGVENGRLALRSAAATAALRAAVTSGAEAEAELGRRGIGIPLPGPDAPPTILHVLPLRHGALRPGLIPSAAAAIFVSTAGSPKPAPEAALAALFDLTPAEARLFAALAGGGTLTDTAATLGIGVGTAKTHLLRLFAKTNTSRQGDLLRLADSLALPR